MNQFYLSGEIVEVPRTKTLNNGNGSVTTLRIKHTYGKFTSYLSVTAFNETAKNCDGISIGTEVVVSGRVGVRKDQTGKFITDLVANEVVTGASTKPKPQEKDFQIFDEHEEIPF